MGLVGDIKKLKRQLAESEEVVTELKTDLILTKAEMEIVKEDVSNVINDAKVLEDKEITDIR